jgi:hypothetical protein
MDVIERHGQHVEASVERDKCAREAIGLLAEDKDKAGMAAATQAKQLDVKVKALEQR